MFFFFRSKLLVYHIGYNMVQAFYGYIAILFDQLSENVNISSGKEWEYNPFYAESDGLSGEA